MSVCLFVCLREGQHKYIHIRTLTDTLRTTYNIRYFRNSQKRLQLDRKRGQGGGSGAPLYLAKDDGPWGSCHGGFAFFAEQQAMGYNAR